MESFTPTTPPLSPGLVVLRVIEEYVPTLSTSIDLKGLHYRYDRSERFISVRAVAPAFVSRLRCHPAPSAYGFTGSGQVEAERAV